MEILLVEDNLAEVLLLKEFLQEVAIPITLHAVERGEVALAFLRYERQYAQAPRPDVISLDLALRGMAGFQLLEEIKNDPVLRATPVVLFSSADYKKDHLVAAVLVAANLTKSLGRAQFIELMEKLLRRRHP